MATAKKAVDEVRRRSSSEPQQQVSQGANRASQNGSASANAAGQAFEEMGRKKGRQMADLVMYHAFKEMGRIFDEEDFSSPVNNLLQSFQSGFDSTIDSQYKLIEEELDPKYLLPSSSDSNNSQNNSQGNSKEITIAVETIN